MRVATAILFFTALFAIVACVALAQQHEYFYSGSSASAENEDHHHTTNSGHSNDATAIVSTTDSQLMAELRALPISRLRRFLSDRDAKCDGCVEKRDLVAAAIEVMHEPTHDDYLSAQLSLEHDLTGPLAAPIPAGGDLDVFYEVPDVDEPIGQSPIARPALKPLSDAEVVALLQLYHMRHLLNEGVLKCGVRYNNGTQYCNFAAPTIVKASE